MPITIDLSKSWEIIDPREQLAAVREDGDAIQFIHDPSEEVQLAALGQNQSSIQCSKRAWVYSNDG